MFWTETHEITLTTYGQKSLSLYHLNKAGFNVPPTMLFMMRDATTWQQDLQSVVARIQSCFATGTSLALRPSFEHEHARSPSILDACDHKRSSLFYNSLATLLFPRQRLSEPEIIQHVNDQIASENGDHAPSLLSWILGKMTQHAASTKFNMGLVVQAMVHVTESDHVSGVLHTHHPLTGEHKPWAETSKQKPGNHLSHGVVKPEQDFDLSRFPASTMTTIESFFGPCELEFAFGRTDRTPTSDFFYLQQRPLSRTAKAAFRIAVEQYRAKRDPKLFFNGLHEKDFAHAVTLKAPGSIKPVAQGLSAGPGFFAGKLCINANHVNRESVLFLVDADVEDVPLMKRAGAVITAKGGITSHASVVCRSLGIPCIVSTEMNRVGHALLTPNQQTLEDGSDLSIDGSTGDIFAEHVTPEASADPYLEEVLLICASLIGLEMQDWKSMSVELGHLKDRPLILWKKAKDHLQNSQ